MLTALWQGEAAERLWCGAPGRPFCEERDVCKHGIQKLNELGVSFFFWDNPIFSGQIMADLQIRWISSGSFQILIPRMSRALTDMIWNPARSERTKTIRLQNHIHVGFLLGLPYALSKDRVPLNPLICHHEFPITGTLNSQSRGVYMISRHIQV